MKISKEAILTAAGILFTIAFIFVVAALYKKGEVSMTESAGQYDSLAAQFGNAELVMYDNGSASGSDVLNLISGLNAGKGYSISVTNGKNNTCTYAYSSESTTLDTALANARKKTHDNYINPYATFSSSLDKDENEVVTKVIFKQVK